MEKIFNINKILFNVCVLNTDIFYNQPTSCMNHYPICHMPIKHNSTNLNVMVTEAIKNSIYISDNSKNYEAGFMPSLQTITEF